MDAEKLAAIWAREEDARRNREMYSKVSLSRRFTQEASACDIPALLAEIDHLNATIQRVRDIVNDKYLDAGQMDVMLHRALEGGES